MVESNPIRFSGQAQENSHRSNSSQSSESRGAKKEKGKASGSNAALKSAMNISKRKIVEYLRVQGASDDEIERWRQSGIKDWQLRRLQVKRVI